MLNTILATKLHIPIPRSQPVPRQRLHHLLKQGLDSRLTIVTAPAGFGKSTLVSEWVRTQTYPTGWLSLDEEDSDSRRFMKHLIAAIQSCYPNVGGEIEDVLQSMELPPMQTLFSALVNDLLNVDDFILVLDDYHAVESVDIDRALSYFIQHLPKHCHLIIVSRAVPSFPLSRLRVHSELTEIRSDDLRFSQIETQEFFDKSVEIELSNTLAEKIEHRTEGWVAGLQLAGLAMKKSTDVQSFVETFSGSNRYVMDYLTDYLTDEVLYQLSGDIRDFLLHTSFLDTLCGRLCDAVTQRHDSQHILEQLEELNLFLIPLDNDRQWYRYHHLFATLLQHRLGQHDEDKRQELHLRAAQWYQDASMIDHAITQFDAAGHYQKTAQLIKQHTSAYIMRGRIGAVQGWLDAIPSSVLIADYLLARYQAWMYYFQQQPDHALEWIEHSTTALEHTMDISNDELITAKSGLMGLRSWFAVQKGNISDAIQLANDSLKDLSDSALGERGMNTVFLADALAEGGRTQDAVATYEIALGLNEASGNHIAVAGIVRVIARLRLAQGKLKQADSFLKTAITRADNLGYSASSASATRTIMLSIYYEQNALNIMDIELPKVWELIKYAPTKATAPFHLISAKYHYARGKIDQTKKALQQCQQDVEGWTVSHQKTNLQARIIRLYLRLGDLKIPYEWLRSIDMDHATLHHQYIDTYLAIIDVLYVQNSVESRQQAFALLDDLSVLCSDLDSDGYQIEVCCLRALLLVAQNQLIKALVPLRQALAFAEPEGYMRIFIDYGQPMSYLLYEAVARSIQKSYAGMLLTHFSLTEDQPLRDEADNIIEPLSGRELEVLQLLGEGLSNREIASKLFLTLNTIKVHNRNIFGKLQVKNRTQAVAKARQLGIINQ